MVETAKSQDEQKSAPYAKVILVCVVTFVLLVSYAKSTPRTLFTSIQEHFGLATSRSTLHQIVESVPAIVLPPFVGCITKQVGPVRTLAYFALITLAGMSLSFLSVVFSQPQFVVFLVGRFFVGGGFGACAVANKLILKSWFTSSEITLAMSWPKIGQLLGYSLDGVASPRMSIEVAFLMDVVAALLCLGLLWVMARKPAPIITRSVTEAVLVDQDGLPESSSRKSNRGILRLIVFVAQQMKRDLVQFPLIFWLLLCVQLCFNGVTEAWTSVLSDVLMHEYGFSEAQAGLLRNIVYWTGFSRPLFALVLPRRKVLLMGTCAIMALVQLGYALGPLDQWVILAGMCVEGLCTALFSVALVPMYLHVVGDGAAGTALGLSQSSGAVAKIGTLALAAMIKDRSGSYKSYEIINASLLAMGLLISIIIAVRYPRSLFDALEVRLHKGWDLAPYRSRVKRYMANTLRESLTDVLGLDAPWSQYDSLYVVVESASDLMGRDANGLSDPYVRVKLKHGHKTLESQRTSVHKCTLNPVWNERIQQRWVHVDHAEWLVLQVWDKDRIKDDFLGEVSLRMVDIRERDGKKPLKLVIDLACRRNRHKLKRSKVSGTLVFSVEYVSCRAKAKEAEHLVACLLEETHSALTSSIRRNQLKDRVRKRQSIAGVSFKPPKRSKSRFFRNKEPKVELTVPPPLEREEVEFGTVGRGGIRVIDPSVFHTLTAGAGAAYITRDDMDLADVSHVLHSPSHTPSHLHPTTPPPMQRWKSAGHIAPAPAQQRRDRIRNAIRDIAWGHASEAGAPGADLAPSEPSSGSISHSFSVSSLSGSSHSGDTGSVRISVSN